MGFPKTPIDMIAYLRKRGIPLHRISVTLDHGVGESTVTRAVHSLEISFREIRMREVNLSTMKMSYSSNSMNYAFFDVPAEMELTLLGRPGFRNKDFYLNIQVKKRRIR